MEVKDMSHLRQGVAIGAQGPQFRETFNQMVDIFKNMDVIVGGRLEKHGDRFQFFLEGSSDGSGSSGGSGVNLEVVTGIRYDEGTGRLLATRQAVQVSGVVGDPVESEVFEAQPLAAELTNLEKQLSGE